MVIVQGETECNTIGFLGCSKSPYELSNYNFRAEPYGRYNGLLLLNFFKDFIDLCDRDHK